MKRLTLPLLAVLLLGSSVATTRHALTASEFLWLGTGPDLRGAALSGDGSTVVLQSRTSQEEFLRWRQTTGLEPLLIAPQDTTIFTNTGRFAVSEDGNVAAGIFVGNGTSTGFVWTESNGLNAVTSPEGNMFARLSSDGTTAFFISSSAETLTRWRLGEPTLTEHHRLRNNGYWDVSGDGSTLVGTTLEEDLSGRPFRWTEAMGLEILGDESIGAAAAASADGSVIVGGTASGSAARAAFHWTAAEGVVSLGMLPEMTHATAEFVTGDGKTIAGAFGLDGGGGIHPFVWTKETGMEEVGNVPFGEFASLLSFSADGQRLFFTVGNRFPPLVWDREIGTLPLRDFLAEFGIDDELADINISGTSGALVSRDGNTIVGRGINPQGMSDLWMAILSESVALAGDYNNNGRVEQADLDLVLLNWNEPFDDLPAEWVNERPTTGVADQAELDGVLLNWNRTSALGTAAAVPEPASWVMAVLSCLAWLVGRPPRVARLQRPVLDKQTP